MGTDEGTPLRCAFIRAGRICVAASIQSLAFAIAPHVKRSSSRIRQCHGRMLAVAAIRPVVAHVTAFNFVIETSLTHHCHKLRMLS